MPAFIHYLVKGELFRDLSNSDMECFSIHKEFYDDDPIAARIAAFDYYQNYISILLEAAGSSLEEEGWEDLLLRRYINNADGCCEFRGIDVCMIVDDPAMELSREGTVDWEGEGDAYAIHGLGCEFEGYGIEMRAHSLSKELEFYRQYGYKEQGLAKVIDYCEEAAWEEGKREEQPFTIEILETPFCWDGMDLPYWWDPAKQGERGIRRPETDENELRAYINEGENNRKAFLSALPYQENLPGSGDAYLLSVAATLAAYMNSDGGEIFVGIEKDGSATGVEEDLLKLTGKFTCQTVYTTSPVQLQRFFFLCIDDYLGFGLLELDEKEILVLGAVAAISPVWVNGPQGQAFYIRQGDCTIQLQDPEEIAAYCREKWG